MRPKLARKIAPCRRDPSSRTCQMKVSPIRSLRILHRMRYHYDHPVTFDEHRLMICPRDGHDMRLLDSSLSVSLRAYVLWVFDTFENSGARLSFQDARGNMIARLSRGIRPAQTARASGCEICPEGD